MSDPVEQKIHQMQLRRDFEFWWNTQSRFVANKELCLIVWEQAYELGRAEENEACANIAECGIVGHRGWLRKDCELCQLADAIRARLSPSPAEPEKK